MIGAFYLTDKEGAAAFDDADQELIELLAAHAAIAITNARLYERSRELSILSERNRLALELHDVVSQKLFSLVLDRRGGGDAARPRPAGRARAGRRGCSELAREALDELRSLILELRPPDLDRDGLRGALRKHVELLRAAARRGRSSSTLDDGGDARRRARPRRAADRPGGAAQRAAPRRRATASRSGSRAATERCVLEVADDGVGLRSRPTPSCARRHLGLTSMEERARRARRAAARSRSAPGAGDHRAARGARG